MTISLLRELSTTEISMVSGGFYKKDDDDENKKPVGPTKPQEPPEPREPFPNPYGPIEPIKIPILTRPKIKISITIKKHPFDPFDQIDPKTGKKRVRLPAIGIGIIFKF